MHESLPREDPADLRDDDRASRLHDRRIAVRWQDLGLSDAGRLPRSPGGQRVDGRTSRGDHRHQSQSHYDGSAVRTVRSRLARMERRRFGGVLPRLCHFR